MKKLITSLQNGNLTPKDRVLLLVHSYIEEDKTGKEIENLSKNFDEFKGEVNNKLDELMKAVKKE